MKPVRELEYIRHEEELPRFANRGLIEASGACRSRPKRSDFPDSRIGASLKQGGVRFTGTSGTDFPDSRIGASLKPKGPAWALGRKRLLPRFANRGLIEAEHQRQGPGSRSRDFPDSRIGASLKPPGAFRSLPPAVSLPRFANRGLIEARDADPRAVEGDGLPRFANRGLIEATSRRSRCGNSRATSPIRESGPH